MRMDQSGTRGRDFCLYELAPLWLGERTVPFHLRLKTVPLLELKHQRKTSHQTRPDQRRAGRAEQGRADQPIPVQSKAV